MQLQALVSFHPHHPHFPLIQKIMRFQKLPLRFDVNVTRSTLTTQRNKMAPTCCGALRPRCRKKSLCHAVQALMHTAQNDVEEEHPRSKIAFPSEIELRCLRSIERRSRGTRKDSKMGRASRRVRVERDQAVFGGVQWSGQVCQHASKRLAQRKPPRSQLASVPTPN